MFWEGDIGCLGGSRTSSFNVTSVMISIGDSYLVDLAKSAPAIYIEASIGAKLIRHSGDTLHLETREYAEDDASCCPSLTRRVVLKRDAKGNWAEAE